MGVSSGCLYHRKYTCLSGGDFFHGLGEGGNGNTELSRVLKNGPPKILNTATHPLHTLFENEEVIVLSPQVTANTWWNENHIRPYLDFVISNYRIDPRRIYFTGLSAGSSGIHQFLNDDPMRIRSPRP